MFNQATHSFIQPYTTGAGWLYTANASSDTCSSFRSTSVANTLLIYNNTSKTCYLGPTVSSAQLTNSYVNGDTLYYTAVGVYTVNLLNGSSTGPLVASGTYFSRIPTTNGCLLIAMNGDYKHYYVDNAANTLTVVSMTGYDKYYYSLIGSEADLYYIGYPTFNLALGTGIIV